MQLINASVFSDSVKRSNCYMVWGGDVTTAAHTSSRSNVDLEVGCLIDLATGLVTFTVNGKEISTSYQVLSKCVVQPEGINQKKVHQWFILCCIKQLQCIML